MARQSYYTQPAQKHLDIYYDFSGGLNTMSADDNMSDIELSDICNMDIVSRGSLKRRHGMKEYLNAPIAGKGQGYFRYYKDENIFEEILAISGKLYKDGIELPIEGLTSFQEEKRVEAVQFQNRLWIATGTKLVEYDGERAKVVEPYKPQPLEALYIGTNALADDPNNFMQDGEAISMRIDGLTFSSRYGIVNEEVTLTAYISKPAEREVEFQFEHRHTFMEEGKWELGQDWSASKTFVFKTSAEGDVQFRVNMRQKGLTVAETQYLVPKYKVKPTVDPNDKPVDSLNIQKCTRIILHWNRLILYGDESQPDAIYISHLNNPNYFPIPNSLRFENGRNEKLTALVQYRDMIIAFTPTTIQALFGKSPLDFKRITLNTTTGCIAPYSPVVMKNYITFLSLEGVHILKSVGYVNDKANVEKVDQKIDNIIYRDKDALGLVHDGQYHIVFPSRKERFRMNIENYAWVKDYSERMDFQHVWDIDGVMYGQDGAGHILRFDKDAWDDAGTSYDDFFETKYQSFGYPQHTKKLKELQVLVSPKYGNIISTVHVYADSSKVINADSSYASVNADGEVVWNVKTTPNFEIPVEEYTGTALGDWKIGKSPFGVQEYVRSKLSLSGKCRSVKMRMVHSEQKPNHVLGIAYVYKMKKP